MDIVSRLRQFMEYRKIPITQFADTCNIPRPTLSQLLNGRNKKVSDELIGKIHDAYPALSVLWLMFGEGDMLVNGNMQTSEPQKGPSITFADDEPAMNQGDTTPSLFSENIQKNDADNFAIENTQRHDSPIANHINLSGIKPDGGGDDEPTKKTATISFTPNAETAELDSRKKIHNIIVYYSDNSFEVFVPNTPR